MVPDWIVSDSKPQNDFQMKNTNTFGVHFILRRNKEKDGLCPVHARITVNKSRVEMSLKKFLSVKEWNNGKGCAKPTTTRLKEFNSFLEEVRSKLVTHYQELVLHNQDVYAEAVKNAYLDIDPKAEEAKKNAEPEKTLRWLIKEHNTIMQAVLKKGSLKNYYTTERYIHKFLDKTYKSGDTSLGMQFKL